MINETQHEEEFIPRECAPRNRKQGGSNISLFLWFYAHWFFCCGIQNTLVCIAVLYLCAETEKTTICFVGGIATLQNSVTEYQEVQRGYIGYYEGLANRRKR